MSLACAIDGGWHGWLWLLPFVPFAGVWLTHKLTCRPEINTITPLAQRGQHWSSCDLAGLRPWTHILPQWVQCSIYRAAHGDWPRMLGGCCK